MLETIFPNGIKQPVLDLGGKSLLKNEVYLAIRDIVWRRYFYYFTWLESLNASTAQANDSGGSTEANITVPGAWDTATSNSASLSFGSAGCVLVTGTTNSSAAGIAKRPTAQSIIRLDRNQRFRTAFRLSAITNQTAYLARGGIAIAGMSSLYYGFRITGSTLQGVVSNGNASDRTTVNLGVTLAANTTYDVEALYVPGDRCDFFVRNSTTGIYERRGSITSTASNTGLPIGTTSTEFFEFYLINSAAENKQMTVSFIEYIQER